MIIDSTCNYQECLDTGMELAEKFGVRYVYVEYRVKVEDIGVSDERLSGREGMRSQRSGVARPPVDALAFAPERPDYEGLFRRWIERSCRPEAGGIVVNTASKKPEECVKEILEQIPELKICDN